MAIAGNGIPPFNIQSAEHSINIGRAVLEIELVRNCDPSSSENSHISFRIVTESQYFDISHKNHNSEQFQFGTMKKFHSDNV